MRAIAALSVLVFHVTYAFPFPRSEVWQYVSQRNAGPPITGVVLFFLISGFVLYRPFVQARLAGEPMPPLVPYAVRRVARIVPAYWVALAIVTVWLGLHQVMSPGGVIRYFGFLQVYGSIDTAGGGISPAWTLCVEVTFYAALPLLALGVRRLGAGRSPVRSEFAMCAALVLVSIAWQAVICVAVPTSNGWKVPLLWTLPGSLDLFAGGMALAIATVAVAREDRAPRLLVLVDRVPWLPWLLAAAVFYLVGRTPSLMKDGFAAWWLPSHELKALGCALLLVPVVLGAREHGWLRRVLSWRPLIWLGSISYGIYLWHKPLLEKLSPHLVHNGELFTALALSAITIAVAAVSFYAVERPAQRLARRFLRARAVRSEAPPLVALTSSYGATAPEDSGA
jgi:peptidoglycan/LPS O-acetylase OafA/YrhL